MLSVPTRITFPVDMKEMTGSLGRETARYIFGHNQGACTPKRYLANSPVDIKSPVPVTVYRDGPVVIHVRNFDEKGLPTEPPFEHGSFPETGTAVKVISALPAAASYSEFDRAWVAIEAPRTFKWHIANTLMNLVTAGKKSIMPPYRVFTMNRKTFDALYQAPAFNS